MSRHKCSWPEATGQRLWQHCRGTCQPQPQACPTYQGRVGRSIGALGRDGTLARTLCLCTQGDFSSVGFPVDSPWGLSPRRPGSAISLQPVISPACGCDCPGPFFPSVSTATWAARKFARVSDNCAEGSRKRADGKQVSAGQLLPPASLRCRRVRKGPGCALGGHQGRVSSPT